MTGGIEDAKAVEARNAGKGGREICRQDREHVWRHQGCENKSADKGVLDERRLVITEAGTVTLRSAVANDIVWRFTAIPDRAPTIALTKDPEPQAARRAAAHLQARGRLRRGRRAGVSSSSKDGKGTNGEPPRNLFDAPDVLAGAAAGAHQATASGRPPRISPSIRGPAPTWRMTLTARDEAGNEGASAPSRAAAAGARVHQAGGARADRAAAHRWRSTPSAQARVLNALDALTIAPGAVQRRELTSISACSSIFWQLRERQERRPAARRGRAHVGHGGHDRGRQHVRRRGGAARRRRKRCARRSSAARPTRRSRSSPTSCARRSTSSCRRSPSRCGANPQQLARPLDPNTRQLRPQDLKNMIDRMEQMARTGAKRRRAPAAAGAAVRCSTTCRWRSPASRAATATTT